MKNFRTAELQNYRTAEPEINGWVKNLKILKIKIAIMEYLYLDGELYMVSKSDMENVSHAIGNCCGSCCPETLQELRRVFTDIKRRYKAFDVEGPHTTPYEQFDPTSADYYKNHEFGLPFGNE